MSVFYSIPPENLKKPLVKKKFKYLIVGIMPLKVTIKSRVAYEEHAIALLIPANFNKAYRLSKLRSQNLQRKSENVPQVNLSINAKLPIMHFGSLPNFASNITQI